MKFVTSSNNLLALFVCDSAINTDRSLVNTWKKDLDLEQINKVMKILSIFGLDRIYSRDSMPDVDNAYRILSS